MKKFSCIIIGTIILNIGAFSQTKTEITDLVKIASNDITNKCKIIPLEIRPNDDTTCNTYFSKVGMAVVTKPLVSKYDKNGKRYNEKEIQYQCRIHVVYDCDQYRIILFDEPVITRVDVIENLNENAPTKKAVIIEKDGTYMVDGFNYAGLTALTKKRLQDIGETAMKPAKKLFSKTIEE
jgi:hypothetical protein